LADLSQNISNSLNLFGGAPANQWGAITWGVDDWGYGANSTLLRFTKLVANAQASDTAITKSGNFVRTIENTQGLSSAPDALYLQDGSGYFYIAPNNTTDLEERYTPDWTAGSDPADGWAAQTFTTSWSES